MVSKVIYWFSLL